MSIKQRKYSALLLTLTFATAALVSSCSRERETDPEAPSSVAEEEAPDWESIRQDLRRQARGIAFDRAARTVERKEVAEKLALEWPVEAPTKDRESVKKELDRSLAEKVEQRYPQQQFGKFQQEIEEQHPVKKKGDLVTFTVRQGRGSAPTVEGMFREITATHVRIGDRWVLRSDMKERDLAMFDPDVRDKLVTEKYRREAAVYHGKRDAYADSIRRDHYIEGFRKEGYIYHNGRFIAASELLDQTVQNAVEKQAKRMQPDVEREVFETAGFVFKEGEWQPSAVKRTFGLFKGK